VGTLGLESYALGVIPMELPLDAGDVSPVTIGGTQCSTQRSS